jgi:UDP:flavonoid glycosyltransferase YjiC (YdhE family)
VTAIAYYVSGHGFGHAVRSAEVIRALLLRRPNLAIHVRTSAPAWLFPPDVRLTPIQLDVGVAQSDALHLDPDATLRQAAELDRTLEPLIAREAATLRAVGVRLVVGDIPPPAFRAARLAGLPGVAIANFGWDWIYGPFVTARPEYGWLLERFRAGYAEADLLLRLPLHGDLSAFRRIEDVPLIVRPPSGPRPVVRERLGLRDDEHVVLLGFGGLGLRDLPLASLAAMPYYTFLATEKELPRSGTPPRNVRLVPVAPENYNDFIAASDVVVSKPGYGMVATCLALGVPLLCTDRGGFPEDDVLLRAVQETGRGAHIPPEELLAGRLGPYLDRVLASRRSPPPVRSDGTEVIADRLLSLLDRRERTD